MKNARRTLLLCVASFSVLIVVIWIHWFQQISPPPLQYRANGEKLNFATLARNERIKVDKLFVYCRGDPIAREYVIEGGPSPTFRSVELEVKWRDDGRSETAFRAASLPCKLSPAEIAGLQTTLYLFRALKEEHSSAQLSYVFSYWRDEKKIGEEEFVGFYFSERLSYLSAQASHSANERAERIEELAKECSISPSDLRRAVTLEMLETKE